MSAVLMARKSKPFVMRGGAPAPARATIHDAPDPRVRPVRTRPLEPDQVRVITRPGATDPRLRPTDRCFQRWSTTPSQQGSPRATHIRFLSGQIAPAAPLPDREALMVDHAVRAAPAWAARFVKLWYRSGSTTQEIADLLGIRRRQAIYEERHLVLAYFLGRLSQMGVTLPSWDPDP